MPTFESAYLADLATQIFAACGTPADDASLMARELVDANLMGLDSHGVLRIPEYVDQIEQGYIVPGATITVQAETPTTAVVDCGQNFGQVGAFAALAVAMRKAREHRLGCVVTQRCNHVGRLGAYPQRAAEQDLLCVATTNAPSGWHVVAPWGGRAGRLGTNPFAYAVPTPGRPLVADMATSVLSEGRIRVLLRQRQVLPDAAVLDAGGRVTRDPAAFYGPPRGVLLPFGGEVGYKGFALALLVEILSGTLAGSGMAEGSLAGCGLCLLVVDPSAFVAIARFKRLMEELCVYLKSAPVAEGFEEIVLPGERDFRKMEETKQQGITLDATTWSHIAETARRKGVPISVASPSPEPAD